MSSVYQASAYIDRCVCLIFTTASTHYAVRFDHKGIRQHLTVCPEICHFSVFTKRHEGHGKHCVLLALYGITTIAWTFTVK